MSAPQHTPGPWEVQVQGDTHRTVQPVSGGGTGWHDLGGPDESYMSVSGVISEADASLIAAAPDLLTATSGAHDAMMRAADLMEHAGLREDAERLRRQATECRAAIVKAGKA